MSNVLSKKTRRDELAPEEGEAILKELQRIPLQKHSNERLMKPVFALAAETRRSFYDCLYLALAEGYRWAGRDRGPEILFLVGGESLWKANAMG